MRLFLFFFNRLDVMEQITIKNALRCYIDQPENIKIEGDKLLKNYASKLLGKMNKGNLVKF
jgi:hypothetical protein